MSPLARQRQVAHGYAQGVDLPTPAVLFLNAEVASLAMAEFVNLWASYRTTSPLLYYDLLNARLTSAKAERQMSCIACGEGRGLALGEQREGVCRLPSSFSQLHPCHDLVATCLL